MASFGKIRNGAVAKFKVLCIFVKAWCWFFATFSSPKTLAVMVGRPSTPKLKEKITRQWTKKFYTRKDKGLSNGGCG